MIRWRDLIDRLAWRATDRVRARVIVKGRMGEGWYDVDRRLALPKGATLSTLIDEADRRGLRLSDAIAASPHLRDTLMWNGQRTPVEENLARVVEDGDEIYLLGPLAGG
ncbi:MAG: MoaD/ThiS family protein [Myxococcota bacterium]